VGCVLTTHYQEVGCGDTAKGEINNMKSNSGLTKAAFISNTLIIIAAGHGIAPIFFFEVFMLFSYNGAAKFFSLQGNYESTLFAATMISLLGQLILIIGAGRDNRLLKLSSLVILWIGFIYLVHNITQGDGLAQFSFVTGLPFLIISSILFVKLCLPEKDVINNDELNEN
jgi:hypothetical protein